MINTFTMINAILRCQILFYILNYNKKHLLIRITSKLRKIMLNNKDRDNNNLNWKDSELAIFIIITIKTDNNRKKIRQ